MDNANNLTGSVNKDIFYKRVSTMIIQSVRAAGGDEGNVQRIFDDNQLLKQVGLLIMGKLRVVGLFPCQISAAELIPKDENGWQWEVIEDVAQTITSVTDLDFVSFLEERETYVDNTKLRKRAVLLKSNHGLCDAKYLLEHQQEIPETLRGKTIVFTGTVAFDRRPPRGLIRVVRLCWKDDRWVLFWDWLCNGFRNGRDKYVLPHIKSKKVSRSVRAR